MTRLLTSLAASAAALGLLVGLAGPANAATRGVDDPRYDALTLVDITSVTIQNTADDLVVKVVAPDFRPETPTTPYQTLITWSRVLVALEFRSGPENFPVSRSWDVELSETDAGRPRRLALSQVGEDDPIGRPCSGASYQLSAGLLELVVPQSCFGRYAGTVRMKTTLLESSADLVGDSGHAYAYRTPSSDYTRSTGWINRG